MDQALRDELYQAYVGEAKAVLRLILFAEKAESEGYPQIAHLFRVVAESEKIHGKRVLRLLREILGTEENLKSSFESEVQVAGVSYDRMIKLATELNDTAALTILTNSRDVEDIHAKLYKEAMNHMMEERETTYHVCDVCGYVSDGVVPEVCPVCGAKQEHFYKF
jgi:rubrerythrin